MSSLSDGFQRSSANMIDSSRSVGPLLLMR